MKMENWKIEIGKFATSSEVNRLPIFKFPFSIFRFTQSPTPAFGRLIAPREAYTWNFLFLAFFGPAR